MRCFNGKKKIVLCCFYTFKFSDQTNIRRTRSVNRHLVIIPVFDLAPDQDGAEQDEPEELDFMFDEELEQMDGRRNTFTDWSDEETDGEIDDHDVNKILIVTQTPPYLRKHPGGDRTGHHTSRAKLTSELVKVINDGLFYYEQDLWDDTYEPEYATIKVRLLSWTMRL